MAISLEKVQRTAPHLVSLVKSADAALTTRRLQGTVAKVALVLDFSGSMRAAYRSGAMQRLAEKVLALAVNLDDDGAIDLFVFDTHAAHLGEITLEGHRGAIEKLTDGRRMGTTNYAGAFTAVRDHFFPGTPHPTSLKAFFAGAPKHEPAAVPVYALFLTDGAPNSKADAVRVLTKVSRSPVFWKFLSIGGERIPFLEKLDDLESRFVDNADYHPVGDVDGIPDARLFEILLEEYPEWLAEVRRKGLIT